MAAATPRPAPSIVGYTRRPSSAWHRRPWGSGCWSFRVTTGCPRHKTAGHSGSRPGADAPYFWSTGGLLKRIDGRVDEARLSHPSISVVRAGHLGLYPSLLDLIERRAREAINGGMRREGLLAVCGRPSCASVAVGRSV